MSNSKFLELQQAIKTDSLIVFAGAGTSLNLGLPSWKSLVLNILQNIINENDNRYKNLYNLLKEDIMNPLEVLTHLEQAGFMDKTTALLKELIKEDKYDINKLSLQRKILELTKKIITTNYDKVFELAMPLENTISDKENSFEMARILKLNEFLFKIHGDIGDPDKCILFKSQYKRAYQNEAYLTTLKTLFIQKTILFVGFSLTDPYIEQIIKAIDSTYNSMNGKHYIITADSGFIDGKYGRTVVSIPIDNHKELENKLNELIKYKKDPTTDVFLSDPRFNVPRTYCRLIGREKQLGEIMRKIAHPAPVTVIYGHTGVGKTSLALETAYVSLRRSPLQIKNVVEFQYVVWIPLHEAKDVKNVTEYICNEVGRQLGKRTVEQTTDFKSKKKLAKEILVAEKVLLVLDSYQSVTTSAKKKELNDFIIHLFEGLPINSVKTEILIINTVKDTYTYSKSDYPFKHAPCKLGGLSKEDSLVYLRQEAKNQSVHLGKFGNNDVLTKVYIATGGTPNLMNLAIGYLKKQALSLGQLDLPEEELRKLFEYPYPIPWKHLSPQSRDLLAVFLIFENQVNIYRDALHYVSGLSNKGFTKSINELHDWNLLIVNIEEQEYTVHSSLLNFLKSKANVLDTEAIKHRFIAYYTNFIKNKIQRAEPSEVYWNTLVSEEMRYLDKHKYSIRLAMTWAMRGRAFEQDFLQFTLLLVHYMDSRLYNQERLEAVTRAITICQARQLHYKEALFRIDSLGWTYIEENNSFEACKEIKRGIEIAESSAFSIEGNSPSKDSPGMNPIIPEANRSEFFTKHQQDDLLSLGYAWLARAKAELDLKEEANENLRKTTAYLKNLDGTKSWIKSRICEAHGDVYYKSRKYKKAHDFYIQAQAQSEFYGGEGNNYRVNPRIGLSLICIGTLKHVNKAESIFSALLKNTTTNVAKLYCDYGLVLVNLKKAQLAKNKELYRKAEEDLTRLDHEVRGGQAMANNILLKFINQAESEIIKHAAASTPSLLEYP